MLHHALRLHARATIHAADTGDRLHVRNTAGPRTERHGGVRLPRSHRTRQNACGCQSREKNCAHRRSIAYRDCLPRIKLLRTIIPHARFANGRESDCLRPGVALAPSTLPQYEFDLVACDADILELAVGKPRQRAPLPRPFSGISPFAKPTPHRPAPQAAENSANGRVQVVGEMGEPFCRWARRRSRRAHQIGSILMIGLQKSHDAHPF
jgi:hypothetical protein